MTTALLAPVTLDHPVAELPDLLGVSRDTIYSWLDRLKISPYKISGEGNRSYITSDDLVQLRQLQMGAIAPPAKPTPDSPIIQMDSVLLVERMASALAPLLKQDQTPAHETRLDQVRTIREVMETLDMMSEKGIKPSTSDLKVLLDRTVSGDRFTSHGFMFAKIGKNGRFASWSVEKL